MLKRRFGLEKSNTTQNMVSKKHDEDGKEQEALAKRFFEEDQQDPRLKELYGNLPIITSRVLITAPKDFFNKYDDTIHDIVATIQENLSSNPKGSEIISSVQRNPTDISIRKSAYSLLSQQLYTNLEEKVPSLQKFEGIDRQIILARVADELVGIGPLEPFWKDKSITEIIANGPFDIEYEKGGIIHVCQSCHFRNRDHLVDLINKLYASIDRQVTRTNPLVKGRLYDNSRMMCVHTVVAPDGPNFNIRRHIDTYWTPDDIIKSGTANKEILTWIGNHINAGFSFFVFGGTGTGKTSLLNSLTSFYPDNERIVTLEDNLEMKPNPHKLLAAAMETVDAKPGTTNPGITMRDLVKASLQMRPDTIIIGEVTDSAAYDLCQAANTGHHASSSIHANSASDAIKRLMSLVSQSELVSNDAALDLISAAFDFIVAVDRFSIDGSRKITSIYEVGEAVEVNEAGQPYLPIHKIWEFIPDEIDAVEGVKVTGRWVKVGDMSDYRNAKNNAALSKDKTWEELRALSHTDEIKAEEAEKKRLNVF